MEPALMDRYVHTDDLRSIELTVRENLTFREERFADGPSVIVTDEVEGRHLRIGLREYHFLSAFRSGTTLAQALIRESQLYGDAGLTNQEGESVCKWLIEQRILVAADPLIVASGFQGDSDRSLRPSARRWNAISFRQSFSPPNSLLNQLSSIGSFAFSKIGFLCWFLLAISSFIVVLSNFQVDRLQQDFVISIDQFIRMTLIWLVLKIVHELGHALAVRRFGGSVREVGLLWILFAPIPYVDVSSSWRFQSSWHRIVTALAGVYFELTIAFVAAIGGCYSHDPLLRQTLWETAFIGSFATILVNLNPLMRFDGYFVLSDLVRIPNLYATAQSSFLDLLRMIFFGVPLQRTPTLRKWTEWSIRLYGASCFIWGQVVSFGLLIAAVTLAGGIGWLLAVSALISWYSAPLYRSIKQLKQAFANPNFNQRRFGLAVGATAAMALGILSSPLPFTMRLPAIIVGATDEELASNAAGFVETIQVRDGEKVVAGQVILTLRNDELQLELFDLEKQIEQSEIRTRVLQREKNRVEMEIEQSHLAELEEKYEQVEKQIADLTIVSPADGLLISTQLKSLAGSYVERGQSIGRVISANEIGCKFVARQADLKRIEGRLEQEVQITTRSTTSIAVAGRIEKLIPRATTRIAIPELTSLFGGPIAVRHATNPTEQDEQDSEETSGLTDDSKPASQSLSDYEYTEPRIVGEVIFSGNVEQKLAIGQRCDVSFRDDRSIGSWLAHVLLPEFDSWHWLSAPGSNARHEVAASTSIR